MAAQDFRPEGRFPAHGKTGEHFWVLVHQLWFEIDAVPEGRDRWQASGIRRYRLADGRELVALDPSRFVISSTGEELRRSNVVAAISTWPQVRAQSTWPESQERTASR